jgi:hypothetical protein
VGAGAGWLTNKAHSLEPEAELVLRHQNRASLLSARPTTRLRARTRLWKGLIYLNDLMREPWGRMAVTDRPGLEAASCECYHTARREFARLLGAGAAQHSD